MQYKYRRNMIQIEKIYNTNTKQKDEEEGPHDAGGWWYKYNTNSIKIQHKNSKSKI